MNESEVWAKLVAVEVEVQKIRADVVWMREQVEGLMEGIAKNPLLKGMVK